MTVKQANALADWVAAKDKNLTTIYITHGHGDHWFEPALCSSDSRRLEWLLGPML